jgi:SHS2 domain-containing protein
MAFKFHEHTADIAFEATGKTLSELFQSAAEALAETLIYNPDQIQPKILRNLSIQNQDLEFLLHDFLEELIFLKDTEGLLLRVEELNISDSPEGFLMTARLQGEPIDPVRHEQRADVKAVTFHQYRLEHEGTGWNCYIILDV